MNNEVERVQTSDIDSSTDTGHRLLAASWYLSGSILQHEGDASPVYFSDFKVDFYNKDIDLESGTPAYNRRIHQAIMLYEEVLRYKQLVELNGRRCLCSVPKEIKREVFLDKTSAWISEASFLFILDGDYEDHENDKVSNYKRAIEVAEESEDDELLTEIRDSLIVRGYWDAVDPEDAIRAVRRLNTDAPDRRWLILCYTLAFYINFEVSDVLSNQDFLEFAEVDVSSELPLVSLLNTFPGLLDRIVEIEETDEDIGTYELDTLKARVVERLQVRIREFNEDLDQGEVGRVYEDFLDAARRLEFL